MNNNILKIEIKPIGSYFDIDSDGYLINPASLEKIQEEYKPLIKEIIDIYKEIYGEHLKQVYLRGSVAKGEAIKGVSDIDTFAYVDLSPKYLKKNNTNRGMRKHLEEKYDFIEDIEMSAFSLSDIPNDYIILNQSVCVHGDPLKVPKLRPGKELAIHVSEFHNLFLWFEKFLVKENEAEEEIKKSCSWLMKRLLRVGFEITMEREKKYTRDLYLCYETFAKYYPEKETEMREVLTLALNPITDKDEIKRVIDGLGQWLLLEISKYFEVKK